FNSPLGACEICRGFGRSIGIDYGLVIPDASKTLRDGTIKPWQTQSYAECQPWPLYLIPIPPYLRYLRLYTPSSQPRRTRTRLMKRRSIAGEFGRREKRPTPMLRI
ncbi:MAG: hypothetical protein L0220_22735, partial [Acidobacteria bacterium]|nr:hypothetical protein [Acidobacteriota bacterium]